MGKGRFRLIAVALAAFGLVLSSCFALRVISISPKVLSPGGTGKIAVKLFPSSSGSNSVSRVVLLIGLQDLDFGTVSQFDTKGNFGGPFARESDDALRDLMLSPGVCAPSGIDADTVEGSFERWKAYRTTNAVDSSVAGLNKVFKVTFEVDREGGTDSTSFGSYIVFSAAWGDSDTDGVPDSGEVICTGVMNGSVAFQP